jgi:hypothetical protein
MFNTNLLVAGSDRFFRLTVFVIAQRLIGSLSDHDISQPKAGKPQLNILFLV